MADKADSKSKDQVAEDGADAKAPKSRGGKAAMMTAFLLVAEAAVIGGAFMMFSKPAETEAVGMPHELEETEPEATLEEVVIFDGYLGNEATGIAFRYPTRVFLKVDARDRIWIEAEAARSAGTIHARLSEIWRSAGRRELDSADLATLEARVQRAFEQEGLFDRRPAIMPSATTEAADDGHGGGHGGGHEADAETTDHAMPGGDIVHDVIVVMDIGRRVNR
jgi:hypothetical protein